jgi:hypothetical protein
MVIEMKYSSIGGQKMYLVSPQSNKRFYSGKRDERLYKTLAGAKTRIKKIRKLTGKQYYISIID